jgi:hypothetical protein
MAHPNCWATELSTKEQRRSLQIGASEGESVPLPAIAHAIRTPYARPIGTELGGLMRDRPRIVSLATIMGCVMLFGFGARGQDAAHTASNACREDMERLCSDVKPGGGAKIRCLKDHEGELSDACRTQITERSRQVHDHASKVIQACGDDAKRLCADVEPGSGRISHCLRDHKADLSSNCRDGLDQLPR